MSFGIKTTNTSKQVKLFKCTKLWHILIMSATITTCFNASGVTSRPNINTHNNNYLKDSNKEFIFEPLIDENLMTDDPNNHENRLKRDTSTISANDNEHRVWSNPIEGFVLGYTIPLWTNECTDYEFNITKIQQEKKEYKVGQVKYTFWQWLWDLISLKPQTYRIKRSIVHLDNLIEEERSSSNELITHLTNTIDCFDRKNINGLNIYSTNKLNKEQATRKSLYQQANNYFTIKNTKFKSFHKITKQKMFVSSPTINNQLTFNNNKTINEYKDTTNKQTTSRSPELKNIDFSVYELALKRYRGVLFMINDFIKTSAKKISLINSSVVVLSQNWSQDTEISITNKLVNEHKLTWLYDINTFLHPTKKTTWLNYFDHSRAIYHHMQYYLMLYERVWAESYKIFGTDSSLTLSLRNVFWNTRSLLCTVYRSLAATYQVQKLHKILVDLEQSMEAEQGFVSLNFKRFKGLNAQTLSTKLLLSPIYDEETDRYKYVLGNEDTGKIISFHEDTRKITKMIDDQQTRDTLNKRIGRGFWPENERYFNPGNKKYLLDITALITIKFSQFYQHVLEFVNTSSNNITADCKHNEILIRQKFIIMDDDSNLCEKFASLNKQIAVL